MKKITLFIFGLLLGVAGITKAQFIAPQDVPAQIHQDFAAKYPNLRRVDWEKDGNKFKASFNMQKFAYQLVYNEKGELIMEQQGIPTASLPADVSSGISKNFPDLQVKNAAKIDEKGKTSYKCVLESDNTVVENVYLTADGIVIKTETDDTL